jgi:hypothetical protein
MGCVTQMWDITLKVKRSWRYSAPISKNEGEKGEEHEKK